LISTIKPQNQLLKPFIFYHQVVLLGGFGDVDATWSYDQHQPVRLAGG
jgi:hypothetical protein